MAGICKKCGKNVGCGCQLKDGLCASCRIVPSKPPINVIKPVKK